MGETVMAEAKRYALLVGVGQFDDKDVSDLPTYKNDCVLMKDALVRGLGFLPENIRTAGENGQITGKSFSYSILNFKKALTDKDTFVLYYSGHGLDNSLYFSDTLVDLRSIIRVVDSLPARRKWIILDCCHSGAAKTPETAMIPRTMNLVLADFVDHGTTIMASSGAEQLAVFDDDHSLYTGLLCKAITSDKTTRNGRKSLWDINDKVHSMMDIWNESHAEKIQYPMFRSSEIGSLSFDVSGNDSEQNDCSWGNLDPVFTTEDYTVTSVKSLSTAAVKRNCAFIKLSCDNTEENILRITNEVVDLVKGMNLDNRHAGYVAKVVWCYFGLDASDMIKSNYALYTIWAVDPEQRRIHFTENKNAHVVDDIYIYRNGAYELVRRMNQPDTDPEEYMQSLNIAMSDIINMGEMFVRDITEVYNKTMDINTFRDAYKVWIRKVKKDYIKLTDMSSPPDEIYDYSENVLELAGWLVDLGIYIDGDKELKHIDHWAIKNAVRRYHESIESISRIQAVALAGLGN